MITTGWPEVDSRTADHWIPETLVREGDPEELRRHVLDVLDADQGHAVAFFISDGPHTADAADEILSGLKVECTLSDRTWRDWSAEDQRARLVALLDGGVSDTPELNHPTRVFVVLASKFSDRLLTTLLKTPRPGA